ncbi:hypothetical protein Lfu02_26350 [Longispora fulva]|uniref:Uncharacterized protein n=1 Tax=Longispora fulva TaxID=619741 RepID=A0A8J7GDU6_9ACTN|nr:hypothetical protein [Longispora fulva]MBG6138768.1 hypothetical protein [Longispora fulva]GIG58263.1 hypothetical protein Lfu02_26350 [Longispora fulva]
MEALWDPASGLSDADRAHFSNLWDSRCALNVPGPFYTGETDTCWTGRLVAPDNVLYGGEYFTEYIFRQPRGADEVQGVMEAARLDPFAGYACDGNDHWTPPSVRAWWESRSWVIDSVTESLRVLESEERAASRDAAEGARQFLAYIGTGLEDDLRAYAVLLGGVDDDW